MHFEHLPTPDHAHLVNSSHGTPPTGLDYGDPVALTYTGTHATATYTYKLPPGTVALRLEAPDGTLVAGACWIVQLSRLPGFIGPPVCDANDGMTDGIATLTVLSVDYYWEGSPRPLSPPGPGAGPRTPSLLVQHASGATAGIVAHLHPLARPHRRHHPARRGGPDRSRAAASVA